MFCVVNHCTVVVIPEELMMMILNSIGEITLFEQMNNRINVLVLFLNQNLLQLFLALYLLICLSD